MMAALPVSNATQARSYEKLVKNRFDTLVCNLWEKYQILSLQWSLKEGTHNKNRGKWRVFNLQTQTETHLIILDCRKSNNVLIKAKFLLRERGTRSKTTVLKESGKQGRRVRVSCLGEFEIVF